MKIRDEVITSWLRKHPGIRDNIIWLFWGLAYGLAFPTYNQSYLIWFAFAPVLLFAYRKPIHLTVRYAFFYSFIFFALTFFWLFGFWLPALFLVLPIYAVFFSFFFFCIAFISKKLPKWRILALPVVWTAGELLRSTGFHGFLWNMVGDSQWSNIVFIQSADIFGVWGISFLILMVNALIAELIEDAWENPQKIWPGILRRNAVKISLVFILIFGNALYGFYALAKNDAIVKKSKSEKLALLQPNIGSHEPWWPKHWENYGIFWKMHAEAALQNPDMIVWSETMVKNYIWYYLNNYSPDEDVNLFNTRFIKMPKEFNVPILISSPATADGKINYNSADYIDPETDKIQDNAKIHLVPFGEWMPGYSDLPIVRDIMELEGAGAFTPSPNWNIIQGRNSKFRVLVCYEDLFASQARLFVLGGLNYFINDTNDGWAYRLGLAHPMWQHLAGATLTAVSVRRPIARAANTGITGIISSTGRFQGNVGIYSRGFYVGNVPIIDENIKTFYVQYGHLFPYLVLAGFVVLFLGAVFKRVKE